jgi:exonuclease SbcC
MKPVRLLLRAIGPFVDETVVDFRDLGERTFFLITGPTGAGKTTVFDAMAFALFGETSGSGRDARDLRSDQAAPDRRTEVIFDFSLGSDLFRVRRSPRQRRPAKKGPGFVDELPKATLWKRTGLAEDAVSGAVLADGWNEVTEKVEEQLGFSADQFRQVVLLPQGQFRRFLSATSGEREEILEALFGTEAFRRIEEALRSQADTLRMESSTIKAQESTVLGGEGVTTREELEARREADRARASERSRLAETLRGREEEHLQELARAKEVVRLLAERDAARREAEELERGRAANDEEKRTLALARKALPLIQQERVLRQRNSEADEASRALKAASLALDAARLRKSSAGQVEAAERARDLDRRRSRERLRVLEEGRGKIAELVELRRAVSLLVGRTEAARAAVHTAEAILRNARGLLEKTGTERVHAEALAPQAVPLQAMLDDLRRRGEGRRRLDRNRGELGPLREADRQAQAAVVLADGRIAERRIAVDQFETAWARGQAALLAWTLKAGEPCAVCGSTSHPAPARAEGRLPDEGELRLARASLRDLEDRRKLAQEAASRTAEALRAQEASVAALEGALGDEARMDPAARAAKEAELLAALDQALAAGLRAPKLAREIDRLVVVERQALGDLDAATGQADALRAEFETATARLNDREASLPPELRDPREVEAAVVKARTASEALEAMFQAATEAARAAEQAAAAAEARFQAAEAAAREAEERARTATADFAARLLAAGFDTGRDFESARRSEQELQALQEKTDAFEARLRSVAERRRRAEEAAGGLEVPSMESLHAGLLRVQEEKDRALGEAAAARRDLERRSQAAQEAARLGARRADVEERFAVLGRLAQVANGQNPERLTLQRFVLRSLLQEVLAVASRRLTVMSRGRYVLQVVRPGGEVRSTGGLELEVQDAWTGVARSVATLSGGEGFLASLALALGLADVVQSRAGGIRLDTILVDEGFGTLDEEALDLAIDAFMGLRERGRLVGIISHVRELRERVDARLEVEASRGTSTARFVLA